VIEKIQASEEIEAVWMMVNNDQPNMKAKTGWIFL
jgi:hypothetical protein